LANRPHQPLEYLSPLAPPAGLEPATYRLTAGRSTIELRRNVIEMDVNYYIRFSVRLQGGFPKVRNLMGRFGNRIRRWHFYKLAHHPPFVKRNFSAKDKPVSRSDGRDRFHTGRGCLL